MVGSCYLSNASESIINLANHQTQRADSIKETKWAFTLSFEDPKLQQGKNVHLIMHEISVISFVNKFLFYFYLLFVLTNKTSGVLKVLKDCEESLKTRSCHSLNCMMWNWSADKGLKALAECHHHGAFAAWGANPLQMVKRDADIEEEEFAASTNRIFYIDACHLQNGELFYAHFNCQLFGYRRTSWAGCLCATPQHDKCLVRQRHTTLHNAAALLLTLWLPVSITPSECLSFLVFRKCTGLVWGCYASQHIQMEESLHATIPKKTCFVWFLQR